MEQWEKDASELNIEDILKEFGSSAQEDTVSEETEIVQDMQEEETVVVWEGKQNRKKKSPSTVQSDTVRLPKITHAVQAKASATDATIAFTPIKAEQEEPEPAYILPQEPQTVPYSDEWEPEYEQPMGEYVPPEPIVFRPKSRLRELKKKLIAGPEKRYYELTEMGFGKLQAAILFCGLVALLASLAAGMYAIGAVPEGRIRFLVFVQLLGLLLSALLGSYQLMEGVSDLFHGKFSLNTLLLFHFIACIADGILCLRDVRMPCCAPFSLNMTMSLWSTYQKRNVELGQMDTMRRATRLDSVVLQEDYYEDTPGVIRGEGQVEDFMDSYNAPSDSERILQRYALIALFLSLGIGITAGVLNGITTGIRFFSASLLVAVPAASYIAVSRPMAILERRLHKLGTVLCGWQGVAALHTKVAFPLEDDVLFPVGSVKMNGLKFYGSRNPDQVVAYTAAVMVANGGNLAPLFSQLLESRNGYHFEVETLRHYPNGGVGGIVNGEAVLVGTRSFLAEMGVEIPETAKISQAVYAAIDGVLNGVYALTYTKTKAAALGLTTLCAYRKLTPILTAKDFMLTEEFITGKFGVNALRILFPERKVRDELANRTPDEDGLVVALTTQDGLAGAAYAVTGAQVLHAATMIGIAVQMVGGILGLLIMLALAVVRADYLLTPENLLLYELIWMIPGLLITEWTRCI